MTSSFRMFRTIAVTVAVVTLVAITAAMAIGLAHEPVSSGALGPDWQCARLALVFTSCKRIVAAKAAAAPAAEGKAPSCPRSAAWRNALGLLR
jgi:hypothetical protein